MQRFLIKLVPLVALLCSFYLLQAHILDYTITPEVGSTPYQEINTGTVIPFSTGSNQVSDALNLGFTFHYSGTNYTQVRVATNGFVNIGTGNSSSSSNNLASTSSFPIVAPFWDSMHAGRTIAGGYERNSQISWLSTGSEPNRVFIIQYKNINWPTSIATSWVDFQVRLYESGAFEFIYGPNSGATLSGTSASIGCNVTPGGTGNYWSWNPTASSWSYSTSTNTIATYIPDGTKINFTPTDVNLTYPADLATNIIPNPTLTWQDNPRALGYRAYFGTDNPPTNLDNGSDLGHVTAYSPAPPLNALGVYYWKIVPYNAGGDMNNVIVRSFTVQAANPPNTATLVSPTLAQPNVYTDTNLYWAAPAAGTPLTGYKLNLGTDNPPTNLTYALDVGNVLTYDHPVNLEYSTTYYWQIVPYNYYGDNLTTTIWSFTTAAAPLTGIKTIDPAGSGPDNYTTFTAAITALNAVDAGSGGVTFNVAANAVFTEAAIMPVIVATGKPGSPIIFQKSGEGANPIVKVPGTSATSDYVFKMLGSDYVTFDGIDVANATGYTSMENAYWFLGLAVGVGRNGCCNNTVKNCTITLNGNNTNTNCILTSTVSGAYNNNNLFENLTLDNSRYAIYLNGVYGVNDSGNTITDCTSYNTSMYTFYGYNQDYLTISNNTVVFPTGKSGSMYGPQIMYNNNSQLFGNEVIGGGVTPNSSSTLYGIYTYTGSGNQIYNNIIRDLTHNGTSGTLYGISLSQQANLICHDNVVSNLASTVSGSSTVYGIYGYGWRNTGICYNNIEETINSVSTGDTYGVYLTGGSLEPNYGEFNVYNNSITNVSGMGNTAGVFCGIPLWQGSRIYSNLIDNIAYTGTGSSLAQGIGCSNGLLNYAYNNMISNIKTLNGTLTGAPQTRGIGITGGLNTHVYFNSLYLDATFNAASSSIAGIYVNLDTLTVKKVYQKNNIVINKCTPGASGKAVALWNASGFGFSVFDAANNQNIYYAGTPGSQNLICCNGAAEYQTLAAYKAAAGGLDSGSFTEDVPFSNIASAPYDLHIDPSQYTCAEGKAIVIAGINTDIDADPRSITLPDIGADEGNFLGYPDPPDNLSIQEIEGTVHLSWDTVTGATGYKIYRSPDPFGFGPEDLVGTSSIPSFNEAAGTGNAKRFYLIKSYSE